MSKNNIFHCVDCGVDTLKIREHFMVLDEVREDASMDTYGGFLCVGCLEARIDANGRRDGYIKGKKKFTLSPPLFTFCPLNIRALFTGSKRLKKRMNAKFAVPDILEAMRASGYTVHKGKVP
jgi:hypothetical protein